MRRIDLWVEQSCLDYDAPLPVISHALFLSSWPRNLSLQIPPRLSMPSPPPHSMTSWNPSQMWAPSVLQVDTSWWCVLAFSFLPSTPPTPPRPHYGPFCNFPIRIHLFSNDDSHLCAVGLCLCHHAALGLFQITGCCGPSWCSSRSPFSGSRTWTVLPSGDLLQCSNHTGMSFIGPGEGNAHFGSFFVLQSVPHIL